MFRGGRFLSGDQRLSVIFLHSTTNLPKAGSDPAMGAIRVTKPHC